MGVRTILGITVRIEIGTGVRPTSEYAIEEEEGRALLIQPCRGLRGKKCGVYAHRPDCCRTFECKVLKDFQSGEISMTKALGTIDRLRGLIKSQDQHAVRECVNRQFLDFR